MVPRSFERVTSLLALVCRRLAPDSIGTAGGCSETPKLHTEVSERMHATCLGGAALAVALWRRLDAARIIDKELHVLRRHRPYQESDHILAQALNMVLGGTCLEDVTKLQHDPALLRIIGGDRLPDPTTVGDFLRRFDESMIPGSLTALRAVVDQLQRRAWARPGSGPEDRLRKL